MDIDHFPLASCNREATGAQLIGLQTDLQDDMHVAKLVTNIEEVVALCNIVRPKSASMVPKLKVNFQKLSEPSASFQVPWVFEFMTRPHLSWSSLWKRPYILCLF